MADQADPVALRRLELPPDLVATIVLVRHGESTFVAEGRFQGRQDSPLSALGERQAALVADRLASREANSTLPIPTGLPTAIWHSPLRRAADTARAIAERQPDVVPVRPNERLTEIAQGEWEGVTVTEVKSRWAAELAAWRRTPTLAHAPGGEPLVDAAERVRAGLAEILTDLDRDSDHNRTPGVPRLPYDPVPGYTTPVSGPPPKPQPWVVLVAHDGIFRLTLINLLGLPLERFWAFPFSLAGITVVTLHDGVAALRAHNLADHLAVLDVEDKAAAVGLDDRRGAL